MEIEDNIGFLNVNKFIVLTIMHVQFLNFKFVNGNKLIVLGVIGEHNQVEV